MHQKGKSALFRQDKARIPRNIDPVNLRELVDVSLPAIA